MTTIDPGLNFFGRSVDAEMKFEDLEQFLAVVHEFLTKTAARLDGKYDRAGLDCSYMFAESFPEILYASVITAVVSFIEREARGFANALREASSLQLGLSDLSGSWLERFRKYCEKLSSVQLGLNDDDWADITGVVEIRNCLVHSGAYLPDFQRRATVEAFVNRHRLLAVDQDFLRADLALAQLVLRNARMFIDHIYRVALQRYPKA